MMMVLVTVSLDHPVSEPNLYYRESQQILPRLTNETLLNTNKSIYKWKHIVQLHVNTKLTIDVLKKKKSLKPSMTSEGEMVNNSFSNVDCNGRKGRGKWESK